MYHRYKKVVPPCRTMKAASKKSKMLRYLILYMACPFQTVVLNRDQSQTFIIMNTATPRTMKHPIRTVSLMHVLALVLVFYHFLLKTFSMNPFHGQYPIKAVIINEAPIRMHRSVQTPVRRKLKGMSTTPTTIRTSFSPFATFLLIAIHASLIIA